ncbi:MAG: protein translocase subunit SecF, partial [Planctomycetota bacterium]
GAEGKVLAVTAYLRKELDGPSPLEVKTALLEHGYPVDRVEQLPAGSASDSYLPFRITTLPSTEDTGSVYDLEERLQGVISGLKVFELSDPFPEVNTIGSRVAQDMQGKVFVAMMIAFGAIVFYISLRFQLKFGLAAIVALVHDIFFTLGMMAIADTLLGGAMSLKINLPVVAALLTVVGYSLNDTIVIFDRIRENIAGKKRGFDYVREVNESINQTLSRTLLTSLTTFTVVLILLIWGGEAIEAFSFALCVGVLVGTYSSIYVASPALIHFNARAEKRRAEMLAEAGSR